jgi:hypothetical protein
MDGRFTLHPAKDNSGGIDNSAFQLHENGIAIKEDTIGELKTTTPLGFYENHGHQKRKKSLVQLTREALPRLENYRNSRRAAKRPSLGELHGGEDVVKVRLKIVQQFLLLLLYLSITRRERQFELEYTNSNSR